MMKTHDTMVRAGSADGREQRSGRENNSPKNAIAAVDQPTCLLFEINHECASQTIGYLRRPDLAPCELFGPMLRAQRTFKARSRFFSLVRRET
jgi:hypothetical protein